MSEAEPAKNVPTGSVFGFRGRIGPARYWAQVAGALAALTQRLRDAGKPPVLVLGFIILLLGVLFLGVELMDVAPFVGPVGVVAVLVFVGHIDAFLKPRTDAA